MFSIVIPTLNEEKIIEDTINQFSVIKHKYNIEIIVSDSGSSDKTVSIAKTTADKVVIYKNDNCNISSQNKNKVINYS